MNLYEYAQATEESGIRYYQELATQAQDAGVKVDEFHNFGRYEDLRQGELELPTDLKD